LKVNSDAVLTSYLPRMEAHHIAKCTESLQHSRHQLLGHSFFEAPPVQHNMGSQQRQKIYHLKIWTEISFIVRELLVSTFINGFK
jgi:hypothetical protein